MILEVRANNCFVFKNQVELSMKADMRCKKFLTNIYSENNFNVLKSVGIYGPNNSGKTCLLKCIKEIFSVMKDITPKITPNLFSENSVAEMGITFLENGKKYSFDFHYDIKNSEFLYEEFIEYRKDEYGNESKIIRIKRDILNEEYFSEDKMIKMMMPVASKSNILIHVFNVEDKDYSKRLTNLKEIKSIIDSFSKKFDFVDMNNIPISKTIDLLKKGDRLQKRIINFLKNADLDMDDMKYIDDAHISLNDSDNLDDEPTEKVLQLSKKLEDKIKLVSIYDGVPIPTLIFDSTGTKKIVALASYIIEALEEGRVLVVDEMDSSIHFKLTRAIVSMFNNELNKNSQLIFTVHDINLMDCKKIFRKEQIWFIQKDKKMNYLYSLADFTYEKDGVRDSTDIIERYKKGALGALPEPDMIKTLLEVYHE